MVKFIILSTQRTGSSLLQALLNSHSRIDSYVEIFMPKNEKKDSFASYRRNSLQRRVLYIVNRSSITRDYLEEFFAKGSPVDAKGFKFMYGQARRFPEVASWCEANDVRVVHLIRENFLKIIVSGKIAKQRGVYHSTRRLDAIKVRIDPRAIISQLEKIEAQVNMYRQIFSYGSYLEVNYEILVANTADEAKRLLRFLDVETDEPLTSDLKKINPNSLADLVENYNDVKNELLGSPFEKFLD